MVERVEKQPEEVAEEERSVEERSPLEVRSDNSDYEFKFVGNTP